MNIMDGTAVSTHLDLIGYNAVSFLVPTILETQINQMWSLWIVSHFLKKVSRSGKSMPVKQTSFIYLLLYTHE